MQLVFCVLFHQHLMLGFICDRLIAFLLLFLCLREMICVLVMLHLNQRIITQVH